MRYLTSTFVILLSGTLAIGQVPKLEIESVIEAKGDYVTFVPKTDATIVTYVGLSGLEPFPTEMLKDSKAFVLSVRGIKDGQYKFVAVAIKQNEFTRVEFTVNVNRGHEPLPEPEVPKPKPPLPVPPKPVEPKLDSAPVQSTGLHVIFIYESGQRVTQDQFNILYGVTVSTWLNTNCDRQNGQPQWRILDKDSVALTEPWKNALTRKRKEIPWIVVVFNKEYVYEGPVAGTQEEFIKFITQWKPKTVTDVKTQSIATVPQNVQTAKTREVGTAPVARPFPSSQVATTQAITAPTVAVRNSQSQVGMQMEHITIGAPMMGRYGVINCTTVG